MIQHGKMICYGRQTDKSPKQVLREATLFFGPAGEGMTLTERDSRHAYYRGDAGVVSIQVSSSDGITHVDVAVEGWDPQAKQFIAQLWPGYLA